MNHRVLLPAVALLLASVARAEDLDGVEKQIHEKLKALKSVSCSMKTNMVMEQPGFSMKNTSEGTYKMVIKDGKSMFRSDTKTSSEQAFGDQKNSTRSEELAISDGTDMYSVTKSDQGTQATHMRVDPKGADLKPFETLRETHTLKLLADEKVDGMDCFVIEAVMKDPAAAAASGKSMTYYHKDTGFMLKMVSFTPDGKPMMTMEYTGCTFNGDIDAATFKWDPKLANGAPIQETGATGG